MNEFRSRSETLAAGAAIVLLLLLFGFPEVIFKGGSLSPSHISRELGYPRNLASVSVYPHFQGKTPFDGILDAGAGSWQLEPSQLFMEDALRNGESPYWNPYSAAGSLGPETLADMKFSPLSLLVALFGAGAATYTWALLAILFSSGLCFFYALHTGLGLSRLASATGTAAFLFNGFAVSHVVNQIAQPYFFTAPLLFALFTFAKRPGRIQFIALVVAHIPLFLSTFLPVTFLCLLAAHILGWCFGRSIRNRDAARLLALQAASAAAAFFLLGPLWFPILASMRVVTTFSIYNARRLTAESIWNFYSLFSPYHFWESYGGWTDDSVKQRITVSSVVAHTGILTALVAAFALSFSGRLRAVGWAAAGLVIICWLRLFGIPPLGLADSLPFLKVIQPQYWQAISALSCSVLAAIGFDRLQSSDASRSPARILYALICGSFFALGVRLGIPSAPVFRVYVAANCALLLLGFVLVLPILRGRSLRRARPILFLCLLGELILSINHVRPARWDLRAQLPGYVMFLKSNLGDGRIMNIGREGTLYPEWGAALQIPEIGTMNTSTLPWYSLFSHRNFGGQENDLFLVNSAPKDSEPAINESALNLLSVRYVLIDKSYRFAAAFFQDRGYPAVFDDGEHVIFENRNALPRAYAAPALARGENVTGKGDFSPLRIAISDDELLLGEGRKAGVSEEGTEPAEAEVKMLLRRNAELRFAVTTTVPSVLVVNDSWHPAWSATVDGRDSYVGRVDDTFRGVVVPSGKHDVVLSYTPSGFYAGLIAALLSAACILLVCIIPIGRMKVGTVPTSY